MGAAHMSTIKKSTINQTPRLSVLQFVLRCELGLLLAAFVFLLLSPWKQGDYVPPFALIIVVTLPILMVLLPAVALFVREAARDHMRTVLEEAVLTATDPLTGPEAGAMEKALELLNNGTCADYIPDAMVERDELKFEAVGTPHPEAVQNALKLIALMEQSGTCISANALASARYNCPPAIQEALGKLPQKKQT